MPTFTAIAFDRLIEPGASNPAHRSSPASMPVPKKIGRRSSEPIPKKKPPPRPQLKPALYATPEVTPLPDSPSSFPPSPYIINHKRRGPRLLKSFSEVNVQTKQKDLEDENADGKGNEAVVSSPAGDLHVTVSNLEPVKEEQVNSACDTNLSSNNGGDLGFGHRESESSSISNGLHMDKVVTLNLGRDGENEDFFDPQDSVSVASYTDGEDNTGTDRAVKVSTPSGEFFDAWEELSSEGGTQNSLRDVEAELREIRLSLLMEIEKRKQVEESLNSMQSQWERIRQGLSLVGIVLPADLTGVAENEQQSSDPIEDICQQVHIARFISDSVGRGIARAEVEMEMEAQLQSKNFEIARLLERLHFYETVNREMSQRNQEAVDQNQMGKKKYSGRLLISASATVGALLLVALMCFWGCFLYKKFGKNDRISLAMDVGAEMARRERQRRRRRQRWIWGSVTTAVALGSAAIAWSYLPMGKGSSSADLDPVPKHDDAAN